MKLAFESHLEYQARAIRSITGLFEGQPLSETTMEFRIEEEGTLSLVSAVANNCILTEEQILSNLQAIQRENELPVSEQLQGINFSVEMETGTGKTYVYLRTIYELNKLYGFKKFVIVVPSVAIREGVLKTLQITHEHFQTLYGSVPLSFQEYDSAKASSVRAFATANTIEVLVINIDSFTRNENVMNKDNDKLSGQKPIEFIRATRPIVIIDEPQNMETDKRRAAIENLGALCTLRYSATHKHLYNLVYSLNPVIAYDLGLVKQIEVDSVMEENGMNDAFVRVESVKATKTKVTAKLTIFSNETSGVQKKSFTVKVGDDLYQISNRREIYKNGYIVETIDATDNSVNFTGGAMLYVGNTQGALTDEVMKVQIQKTVEEHLKKEKAYRSLGIKVLSLFFIDKVANYRTYNAAGEPIKGKFAQWFEASYHELINKPAYQELNSFPIEEIHNGYFSQDRGKIKDTNGETKADNDTYSLIMKDKEKLLDLENPLRFIFSHSALREGWDNPNVFQICTLNESQSEMKKRQEIGRGLRLAVDQTGRRLYDKSINRLTVIANESYHDFAKDLQNEIQEECGVNFEERVKNKNKREIIRYRKGFEADPRFLALWEKIKHKTQYNVRYSTEDLITNAAEVLKKLPTIISPSIRTIKASLVMKTEGVEAQYKSESVKKLAGFRWQAPDVIGYIQNKTELTRTTIARIVHKSERLKDAPANPQLFVDLAVQAIKRTLDDLKISGIKYEKLNGTEYEMSLFEAKELETYIDNLTFRVKDASKTIYEQYIPLDSGVESQFAKDCETSEQVQFYFKLPRWFTIPTPIGTYNPDWALVFENDTKIYFVAETKDTGTPQVDIEKLSREEQHKISCGKAHFAALENVEYRVVKTLSQLVE